MRAIIFYGLVLSFVLASCGYTQVQKEAPEVNHVKTNTKFTIILPEDHSQGYAWQLKDNFDAALVERLNEVWHGKDKGIYFNLKAIAPGRTTLTFVSRHYQDTVETKQFIIEVGDN